MFRNIRKISYPINDYKRGRITLYITVKILSSLLRRITSKHNVDFHCLNCRNSFTTKNKLESYKKVCQNKVIFGIL